MSFQGIDYTTPLSVRSIGRVFRSETSNLKVQTNSSQAQRWDLQITLAPTSDTAQIVDLEDHRFQMGIHTSFTTLMPQPLGVADRIAGVVTNISTRGVTAAGISDVAIDSTSTVTIPKGLYVTFGADPKVYRVTADATVTATDTTATLSVFPPLVQATIDNAGINTAPNISVYYAEDGNDSITYTGNFVRYSLNLVEALV